jgi:hypothetical protein
MHKRRVITTFACGEYFDGTYKQLNAPLRETAYTVRHLSAETTWSYAYVVVRERQVS